MSHQPIRTLISDSAQQPLSKLTKQLNMFDQVDLIDVVVNPTNAIETLQKNGPDLIVLNADLLKQSAQSTIESLRKVSSAEILLASKSYTSGIDAFDLDVTDYVVEPCSHDRLKRALGRVSSKLALRQVRQNPELPPFQHRHITVHSHGVTKRIELSDIIWISARGDYVDIHTKTHSISSLMTLKQLLSKLPEDFFQIHRSHAVNIDFVSSLQHKQRGDYTLTLSTGQSLNVSRNYNRIVPTFRKSK